MIRPKTHDARVRWALALGADPDGSARLAALAKGDVASRWLAVTACHRSRDGALLLRAIEDPSRRVRGKALVVTAVVGDDECAAEALRRAYGMRSTKVLLRQLRRRGRTAPIDVFLDWLAERGAVRELIDELALGSAEAVRKHLTTALDRPSQRFWKRVARHHPAILAEILTARWRAVEGEADPVTRQLTDAHLARIAELAPEQGLVLCEVLLARGIHPRPPVSRALGRHRPRAVLDLVFDEGYESSFGSMELSMSALSRLDVSYLVRLAENIPYWVENWSAVLRRRSRTDAEAVALAWARCPIGKRWMRFLPDFAPYLPESVLLDAWSAWSRAQRDKDGVIGTHEVDRLPAVLREREARRHIHEVVALRPHPGRRLNGYARHLPADELNTVSADLLGHPDGAMRVVALVERLASPRVRDEPERVPECLALIRARKFEQDPVRGAMIGQLVTWPLKFWKTAHLKDVGAIVRDGLDAADLSDSTARLAEALIIRMFAIDARWAGKWLATIIKERGRIYDPRLGAHLDETSARAAGPALYKIAEAWLKRERSHWLLSLVQSLGPFITVIDGMVELVRKARDQTRYAWLPIAFTRVLAEHAPTVHAGSYPKLIATWQRKHPDWLLSLAQVQDIPWTEDMSQAVQQIIRKTRRKEELQLGLSLLRVRDQDSFAELLPEILTKDASLIVLDVVWRYVHRRRTDLLDPYLSAKPVRGRFATGKTAWVLPAKDGFHRWTAVQNQKFAAMLLAVAKDQKRDTPAIIWALTLLPRLLYAPMDGLCALADDKRPAVREKAIRVLARCDAGQGVRTLLECLGDARARFAIYSLRRALLSIPPGVAADILGEAPMRKVTIAKEVVRLLGEIRSEPAYQQLIKLARGELHRDVRIAVLRALWDHLNRESTWEIYRAAVESDDWILACRVGAVPADRLTDTTDRRLSALLAQVVARPEPEARLALLQSSPYLAVRDPERALLSAIRARLDSLYDDEVEAAMTALCARQDESDAQALELTFTALRRDPRALRAASQRLLSTSIRTRASLVSAARALESALEDEPRSLDLYIRIGASYRDVDGLTALLVEIGAAGRFGFEGLDTARMVVRSARHPSDPWTLAHVAALTDAEPPCRRIAVWVLEQCVAVHGWDEAHRAALARLRADDDPDVAGASWRLFPPREDDIVQGDA